VKWQCSIEGLVANPIVGVGTGDTQEFLQACYKEKNFWGEVFRYNSHNQFLQSALGLGLPGLLTLVACLWYQTRIAWAKKDYVYLVFIVIICVCFLTESVLERKQGILF
jgi:O-antigen ligase